jgi:hypothetical protein
MIKMKNDYEVRGDVTAIILKRKTGQPLEVLIDTDLFEKVNAFPNSWCAQWSPSTKSFYARGYLPVTKGQKRELVQLHRWILNPRSFECVDHINHDTLDNRKCNLRIATFSENLQNRISVRSDSYTGIKGVTWRKHANKYQAHIKVNGKFVHLGYFDSTIEAEDTVNEARSKLMPFSQEALN